MEHKETRPRLICAGLQKTATSAVRFALRHKSVGWRVLGYLSGPVAFNQDAMVSKAIGFDAILDLPASAYWREIADHYQHCKVLLTVRDTNEWLDSYEDWLAHLPFVSVAEKAFARKLYGSEVFDRGLYAEAKARNDDEAREWGRKHPGRFLEFDVFRGDNWNQLGPFIGVERRGEFPYVRPGAPQSTWDTHGVKPLGKDAVTWRK